MNTGNFARETGIVMGAVVANAPALGAVVASYVTDDGEGTVVIPEDRQAQFLDAFAMTLAKGCTDVDLLMALQVGKAFATLAGQPSTMEPLFRGIVALLAPHIARHLERVALINAEPMGTA